MRLKRRFTGWPTEASEFDGALERDNSAAFWVTHIKIYESAVLDPMKKLLAELEPEFGEARIFRPNRDTRVSADKSPYKTVIGATIGWGYLQLSANGLAAALGMQAINPDQWESYRRAVADDVSGPKLDRAIALVEERSIEVQGHNSLKTVPEEYPDDHPRRVLLQYRGISASTSWPVAPWLSTAGAKAKVIEFFRAAMPLADWLGEHLWLTRMSEPQQ